MSKILVTGDYGFDYDIYLPIDDDNPPIGTPPAHIAVSIGGAGIALRVLQSAGALLAARAKAEQDTPATHTLEVAFAGKVDAVTSPPTAALWQKYKFGKLGKTVFLRLTLMGQCGIMRA